MREIPYAAQVQELSAIERLLGQGAPWAAAPPPLGPAGRRGCLVCGAAGARLCSGCGAVAYCGAEHQAADARWHGPVCEALLWAREDEEAIAPDPDRSALPAPTPYSGSPLLGWAERLGRLPEAARPDDRRLTWRLSRPLTVVSLAERLGWVGPGSDVFRVHVAGATPAEVQAAPDAWGELPARWPAARVHVAFVGPELAGTRAPAGGARLEVSVRAGLYGPALAEALGQPAVVVAFDAGLVRYPSWERTVRGVVEAGWPLVVTSYSPWELVLEARLLAATGARHLLPPGPNAFASLGPLRSSTIANAVRYENGWMSVALRHRA